MALLLALLLLAIGWLAFTAPLSRSLEPSAPPSITLLSQQGKLIARKGAIIEKPVTVAELPDYVPQAFMAIEDRRFYDHWGIDPQGIARAMWHNLRAGGMREGGSTITQQLAKGVFLSSDRTFGRKAREALIAIWLEAWLSKDQILERYLSNVYFGDNVYGLRAAAHHYFNRSPDDLTIPQAAMLAGLMKAPSRLAPTSNLDGAQDRSRLVMHAMAEEGFITPAEEKRLRPARLHVRPVQTATSGTYFSDWVMAEARDRAGAVYGAQEIRTTLDSPLQRYAERAVRRAGLGKAQVALVAMKPDGEVVAMVGGKDYEKSAFNRATQAQRQPGSTFKLFVYLTALKSGMTPDDLIADKPITTGDYRPSNHDGRYHGMITLREAFARSSNVAAVRLAQKVGVRNIIRTARQLGVESPLESNESLALGTSGITLLELTSAYAAIAADAYPVHPRGLPERERTWMAALMDRQHSFDDRTIDMMRDLLSAAVSRGTGKAAALDARTFGKTGTTQDNRDALFVGYAKGLVTAVWVGNDDNSPLPGIAGGGLPARIWRDFMRNAVEPGAETPAPVKEEVLENESEAPLANISVDTDIGSMNLQLDDQGFSISAEPAPIPDVPPAPPINLLPPDQPAPAEGEPE